MTPERKIEWNTRVVGLSRSRKHVLEAILHGIKRQHRIGEAIIGPKTHELTKDELITEIMGYEFPDMYDDHVSDECPYCHKTIYARVFFADMIQHHKDNCTSRPAQ